MKDDDILKLAEMIDHTNLKPESTLNDIKKLCEEAKKNSFGAVCINPSYVKSAKEYLKGSPVKVCTVIGFPLGATPSEVKAFETEKVIKDGAVEVDMVLNIGAMKSGEIDLVKKDIEAVVIAAKKNLTKVILETCFLTDNEIIKACEIAKEARADFVKTSTGFGPSGASEHHVQLMRKTVGQQMGVKASGGIRDYKAAKAMIDAGATRIGASSGIKILEEFKDLLSKK